MALRDELIDGLDELSTINLPLLASDECIIMRDGLPWRTNIAEVRGTGWGDYEDTATAITPISITGGGGFVTLTNNALGSNTQTNYLPVGVDMLWDAANNRFSFDELRIGETFEIRIDITIQTASNYQDFNLNLFLGNQSYNIPILTGQTFKQAGTYRLARYMGFYVGNELTRTGHGYLKASSDGNVSVTVHGWYIRVSRR